MIIADGPHPPVEDMTIGVNDPCSTSTTRFSYALLFSFSWRLIVPVLTSCGALRQNHTYNAATLCERNGGESSESDSLVPP